jgi:hypothetical protein
MDAIKAVLWSLALAGAGCSSAVHGSVVGPPRGGEAQVRIQNGSVAPGESVLLCRQECDLTSHMEDPFEQSCSGHAVGHALVTQLEGNDMALVQLDPGVFAREGDTISKGASSECAQ